MPEAVGTISADSKQAVLEQLSQRFAGVYGLDPVLVLERIEERWAAPVLAAVWRSRMRRSQISAVRSALSCG